MTGFTADDASVPGGALSGLASSDGGIGWSATLTPAANTEHAGNRISVDLAGVRDAAGNAGSGASTASNNHAVDTVAPVLDKATVNGKQLVLTWTEGLGLDAEHKAAASAFTVMAGGAANAVTNVAVDSAAKTVTLTLTSAVSAGQSVTVSYADPTAGDDANAVQDGAGNNAASLSNQAVRNTTGDSALDTDNDGLPDSAEDQAPGVPGPGGAAAVPGDGNGIRDSLQATAGSASFVTCPKGASKPGDAPATCVTLVMVSRDGKAAADPGSARIIGLEQQDAPTGLPAGLEMPMGLVSFQAALAEGRGSETFSLYLDPDPGINGYWLKNGAGIWVNLASAAWGGGKMLHEGGRLRLDFQIADGGQFDADGKADGVITAPGAAAQMPLSIVGQAPDSGTDGFWF